jgi:hypothetical protein
MGNRRAAYQWWTIDNRSNKIRLQIDVFSFHTENRKLKAENRKPNYA